MVVSAEVKSKVDALIASEHVFIASKSYCPYCTRAKGVFQSFDVEDAKIIELDHVADGAAIQEYLLELTGQRTVPNIFINGKHVGGSDDLAQLANSGQLKALL